MNVGSLYVAFLVDPLIAELSTTYMVAAMGLAGNASAILFDRGGGLIYDDVLNITWLQDANYAQTSGFDADGLMNWDNAKAWAAGLSYFDSVRNVTWTDWRLPYASVIAGQDGSVPRSTTLPESPSPACTGLPGGEAAAAETRSTSPPTKNPGTLSSPGFRCMAWR